MTLKRQAACIKVLGMVVVALTQICWAITPLILTAIFVITCIFWEKPFSKEHFGEVHYPDWVHGVGWFLILVVALQVTNQFLLIKVQF